MTVLDRLLKYPHAAVFDGDPHADVAFRLQHADGDASWAVVDGVLTASNGTSSHTYTLSSLTVSGLAAALQSDGYVVASLHPDIASLSALVLIDGDGSQGESNGDRVFAFTSLLWVLLSAYAGELSGARAQSGEALRQMVITQAEGEWLDLWGSLYAASRLDGETDAQYSQRIPQDAFRLRCNARAIELAIRDATGFDVRIEEPWTEIFKLDTSLLSGPDRFYDGEHIGYHLIRPTAKSNIDWPLVRSVIDRNRAAGVLVLGPRLMFASHVDASDGHFVHFAGIIFGGQSVPYEDRALLDFSLIEDVSIPNRAALQRREFLRNSHVEVEQTYVAHPAHAFRDFRLYLSGSVYLGQTWATAAARSWSADSIETWASLTFAVASSHTRSTEP